MIYFLSCRLRPARSRLDIFEGHQASGTGEEGSCWNSSGVTRVHLYGASNLWFSRRAALAAIRRRFEGPLELGLACGPGRSYGLRAGNPLLTYRPLREVEFPQSPQLAILSDIGNDIAYSQRPDTTSGWVAELAARLEARGSEVVLTGVPVESLRGLPDWLFWLLRTLYYAGQKATKQDILQRLADLDGGLRELASARGYLFLPVDSRWYGFDRFHLRRDRHADCWETWTERLRPALTESQLPTWRSVWGLRPDQYWRRGKELAGLGEYDNILAQTKLWVR